MIEPQLYESGNWTFRFRHGQSKADRVMILLHGWMGDENSMWILARNIPTSFMILAPRAPFLAPEGGYSWRDIEPSTWGLPSILELKPAVDSFMEFLNDWSRSEGLDFGKLDLMGFSQGAAIAHSIALLFPERVRSLAALSGFLPDGAADILSKNKFGGKPIFVYHGRQDEMIPVERAHQAVTMLKSVDAKVTYCESDAGHKVNKECLKAMENFFEAN
jgi:phospholipase/carboxylesterase